MKDYDTLETAVDKYGAPNTAVDNYIGPNKADGTNKKKDNSIQNSNESLDTFENDGAPASKESSILINQDQPSYKQTNQQTPSYPKIDKDFRTVARTNSVRPLNDLKNSDDEQAGFAFERSLTPPYKSRTSKSSKSSMQKKKEKTENQTRPRTKQSKTRIRSVHPYYYV